MLLGSAFSLAHEFDLFEGDHQKLIATNSHGLTPKRRIHLQIRHRRAKHLLYVYINQLASRLGWPSLIPKLVPDSRAAVAETEHEQRWQRFMSTWVSLTRLVRTASDMLFPSSTIKQLLRSGKYLSSLEHFNFLLKSWKASEYDSLKSMSKDFLN